MIPIDARLWPIPLGEHLLLHLCGIPMPENVLQLHEAAEHSPAWECHKGAAEDVRPKVWATTWHQLESRVGSAGLL